MTMDGDRLDDLLDRHFDELLDEAERLELAQRLLESPQARDRFWEMARCNAALRQWGQEEWGRRDASRPAVLPRPARDVDARRTKRPRPATSSFAWWPTAAAVVLVLGCLAWFALPQRVPLQRGVAVLTSTSRALWAGTGPAPRVGAVLNPCSLHLESGFARIEFLRGARVVIEGPAELRLVSENASELRRGRLSAVVPQPAQGFQVAGGGLTAVDYGTKFGYAVPVDGPPEVHVFSGEVGVKASAAASDGVVLGENEAVRLEDSTLIPIPADPGAFVDEAELDRLDREGSEGRLENWRQFSRAFRQRSDLVVYLDFEPSADGFRSMPNAAVGAAPDSVAAVVGASRAEGRWSRKGALEFTGTDDRVRLTVPGTFDSLTFLAWIRAEGTPNRLNGLVMGQTGDEPGETHWYLYRDGALGAGVRIAPRGHGGQWWHTHTEPVFAGERAGAWTFVATVLDRRTGTVSHYVDGLPVKSEPMSLAQSFKLGTVEIGNWGIRQGPGDEQGNFQGRIDEVAILSSALEPGTIRAFYEAGRP